MGLETNNTKKLLRKWDKLELKNDILWFRSTTTDGENC